MRATVPAMEFQIRPLDPRSGKELDQVVEGMQATLLEVVGRPLYERKWLEQRVLDHLDPSSIEGAVYIALAEKYCGHTIVRVEGPGLGLFSTTYVTPAARRYGLGRRLVEQGEKWMRGRGLERACTFTAAHNQPLQQLFGGLGYAMRPADDDFVCLERRLEARPREKLL